MSKVLHLLTLSPRSLQFLSAVTSRSFFWNKTSTRHLDLSFLSFHFVCIYLQDVGFCHRAMVLQLRGWFQRPLDELQSPKLCGGRFTVQQTCLETRMLCYNTSSLCVRLRGCSGKLKEGEASSSNSLRWNKTAVSHSTCFSLRSLFSVVSLCFYGKWYISDLLPALLSSYRLRRSQV